MTRAQAIPLGNTCQDHERSLYVGKAVRGKCARHSYWSNTPPKKIYITKRAQLFTLIIIHTPLDPQLNDLPDADFMEGPSYSDKRTQTLENVPSIQCQKKLTKFCCIFFLVESFFKNVHSFKALETFIQSQRTLLARQKSDIERLRQLKLDIAQKPTQVLSNLSHEVCCSFL